MIKAICSFSALSATYVAFSHEFPITTQIFPSPITSILQSILITFCNMYNVVNRNSEAVKMSSLLSLSIKDILNPHFAFSSWQVMIRNDIFKAIVIMKAHNLRLGNRENQFIFEGLVPPQGHKWLWG